MLELPPLCKELVTCYDIKVFSAAGFICFKKLLCFIYIFFLLMDTLILYWPLQTWKTTLKRNLSYIRIIQLYLSPVLLCCVAPPKLLWWPCEHISVPTWLCFSNSWMAWLGGNGSAPTHNAAPHLLLSLLLTLLLVCYVFLWPLCCLNRLAGSGLLEPLIGTYGPGYASGVPCWVSRCSQYSCVCDFRKSSILTLQNHCPLGSFGEQARSPENIRRFPDW